jgi:hypothetical protein
MRFYNLVLTDPTTGKVATRQGGAGKGTPFIWGTNGSSGSVGAGLAYDPGATDIQFDLQVSTYDQPTGGSGLTLYGISLDDLKQANQFAGPSPGQGLVASLYGGMSAGLPLANPKQAGLLTQGVILQSWGNWVGTEMTLDFVLNASAHTPDNPGNIVLNWTKNTPLSQALSNCLSVAFPGVKQNIAISPKLVLTHDEVGFYPSLEALAACIQNVTANQIVSDDYEGVFISYQGGQLYVYDNTVAPKAQMIQIQFNDLVGQPTWRAVNQFQFMTVLRADIQLGSIVTMPQFKTTDANGKTVQLGGLPGTVTTGPTAALNGAKNVPTFQGNFSITQVRHLGHLRAPDGQSWVSVFNAAPYSGPAPASPTN